MAGNEASNARLLDKTLEDTFPASDPPSQTSPSIATSSSSLVPTTHTGEMRLYRVIEPARAADPFAASTNGGRWSPDGVPCVYASLSPATALLEYLAHLDGPTPPELLLAVASVPADAVQSEVNAPSTWCAFPYRPEVQRIGADWIQSQASLGLRVPSALCDGECNVLLNAQHPRFAALQLVALRPLQLDERIRR